MRTFVLALVFSLIAVSAKGDLLLDLQYTDGSTHKIVNSGDVVMVDLILVDPSDDTFISAEGLATGGGAVVQTGGVAAVASSAAPVQAVPFDPLFTVGGPAIATPRPGLVDAVIVGSIVPAGLGASSVVLATFSFVATGTVAETATLTADVLEPGLPGLGNTTFTSGTDLDALLTDLAATPANFGSVTLEIAAVPEPSTIVMGLLIAGGLVWRRRKAASA